MNYFFFSKKKKKTKGKILLFARLLFCRCSEDISFRQRPQAASHLGAPRSSTLSPCRTRRLPLKPCVMVLNMLPGAGAVPVPVGSPAIQFASIPRPVDPCRSSSPTGLRGEVEDPPPSLGAGEVGEHDVGKACGFGGKGSSPGKMDPKTELSSDASESGPNSAGNASACQRRGRTGDARGKRFPEEGEGVENQLVVGRVQDPRTERHGVLGSDPTMSMSWPLNNDALVQSAR